MIIQNGKVVSLRRDFFVPVSKLFAAWTEPRLMEGWWSGLLVQEMDVRAGGRYEFSFKSLPGEYARGIYKKISPNIELVKTWNTAGLCAGSNAPGTG